VAFYGGNGFYNGVLQNQSHPASIKGEGLELLLARWATIAADPSSILEVAPSISMWSCLTGLVAIRHLASDLFPGWW